MVMISGFTFYEAFHSAGMVFATGSPYDSGVTCAQVGCHSNTNTAAPTVSITSNPAFSGNLYTPGLTYTVNVNGSGVYPKYGFDLEILNSLDPSIAQDQGTFGNPVSNNCQMMVNAGLPTNVTHLQPSGTGNAATFSFQWTAPASDTAFLYCALLGSNFNGSNSGDKVKTTSMVLLPNPMGVSMQGKSMISLEVFPDPFTDEIRVLCVLDRSGPVSIRMFDIQGKGRDLMTEEMQSPGKHEWKFYLNEKLPSGIYFLKTSWPGGCAMQKIVCSQ